LRDLTGLDRPVASYLESQPDVGAMLDDIKSFLVNWLDALARDHRSYVTVAIGCTGGQHRSVYLVEMLSGHFSGQWPTLKRHRELDAHLPK
jgi:RNase adapter protein RapZ